MENHKLKLQNGRNLSYSVCGDEKGKPVFFFHGWPGSRLAMGAFDSIFKSAGLRVISCERPGVGLSDFQTNRALLDWPDDVVALADSLGIEKFSIFGHSGGGPYAIACAYKIPDRMDKVFILAGLSPVDRPNATQDMMFSNRLLFNTAKFSKWLLSIVLGIMANMGGEKFLATMVKSIPEIDKMAISQIGEIVGKDFGEGIRQPDGFVNDFYIITQNWGFKIEDIQKPITIWHGEADVNVPIQMSQYLTEKIPNATLKIIPKQGHFLLYTQMEEIIKNL